MSHSPNDFKEGVVVDIKPFDMLLVGNPGHGRSLFLNHQKVQSVLDGDRRGSNKPTLNINVEISSPNLENLQNSIVDSILTMREKYNTHEQEQNKNTDTMVKIAFPQYSILRNFVKKHGAIIRFFDTNPITAKQKEEEGTPSGKLTGFVDEVTFDEKFQVA